MDVWLDGHNDERKDNQMKRMAGELVGWMDGWMHKLNDGWTYRLMELLISKRCMDNEWIKGCLDEWMDKLIDRLKDEWTIGWIDGCTSGWMNGGMNVRIGLLDIWIM